MTITPLDHRDIPPRRHPAEAPIVPRTSVPMRMVVIDHHPFARERAVARLHQKSGVDIVASGGTAESAITCCERERPDVALVDAFLPGVAASDLVSMIHTASPATRILILTDTPGDPTVAHALSAGAVGVVIRDKAGFAGSPRHTASTTAIGCHSGLPAFVGSVTHRERQVIALVAGGYTNREIGDRLGLSSNTVKSYLRNCMQKLDARNRAQLVAVARRYCLL